VIDELLSLSNEFCCNDVSLLKLFPAIIGSTNNVPLRVYPVDVKANRKARMQIFTNIGDNLRIERTCGVGDFK